MRVRDLTGTTVLHGEMRDTHDGADTHGAHTGQVSARVRRASIRSCNKARCLRAVADEIGHFVPGPLARHRLRAGVAFERSP